MGERPQIFQSTGVRSSVNPAEDHRLTETLTKAEKSIDTNRIHIEFTDLTGSAEAVIAWRSNEKPQYSSVTFSAITGEGVTSVFYFDPLKPEAGIIETETVFSILPYDSQSEALQRNERDEAIHASRKQAVITWLTDGAMNALYLSRGK